MARILVVFLLLSACSNELTVRAAVAEYAAWSELRGTPTVRFVAGPYGIAGVLCRGRVLSLDPTWLSAATRSEVYTVVGHELGHLSTCEDLPALSRTRELLADCLAGAFVQETLSEPEAADAYMFSQGDFLVDSPMHHGTPEERRRAVRQGRVLALNVARTELVRACREVTR